MKKPRHKHPSAAWRARSVATEGDRQDKGRQDKGRQDKGRQDKGRQDKERWSSRRKTEVVLRFFRRETLDASSWELGVTTGRLAEWRDEALAAMQTGLPSRAPDHRDGFIHNLRAEFGDQVMQIKLLQRKIDMLEDGLRPPPRRPSL